MGRNQTFAECHGFGWEADIEVSLHAHSRTVHCAPAVAEADAGDPSCPSIAAASRTLCGRRGGISTRNAPTIRPEISLWRLTSPQTKRYAPSVNRCRALTLRTT